jgi:ATP-binding cassette subfamily F protein 3
VSRSGDIVLRLTELQVAHPGAEGSAIIRVPAELDLLRGSRVAVVGPNGAGKTTLLRTVMGELAPLAGAVRIGANVQAAFFRQAAEDLDAEDSVLDVLLETTYGLMAVARDRAARFLFRGGGLQARRRPQWR